MRKLLLLATLIPLLLASCGKKDHLDADDLDGKWKLIEVFNDATDETYGPPEGQKGKVFIEFSGNTFKGRTKNNEFSNGTFTVTNGNEILFNDFSVTNATEDEWGVTFLFMLQACALQSTLPCKPSSLTQPKRRRIKIDTPQKYTLTFEK